MPDPAAGWYPDTQAPGRLRWWDGEAWTEHRHDPTPPPVPAPPVSVPRAEPKTASPATKRTWGDPIAPATGAAATVASPAPSTPVPAEPLGGPIAPTLAAGSSPAGQPTVPTTGAPVGYNADSIKVSVHNRGVTFVVRALIVAALIGALGGGVWFVALRQTTSIDRADDRRMAHSAAAAFARSMPTAEWTATPSSRSHSPDTTECETARATARRHRTANVDTARFTRATMEVVSGSIDMYESDADAATAMRALRDPAATIDDCVRQDATLSLEAALATPAFQPVVTVDVQIHDTLTLGADGVVYTINAESVNAAGTRIRLSFSFVVARVERGLVTLNYLGGSFNFPRSEFARALMSAFFRELHPDPTDPPLTFASPDPTTL